MFKYYGLKKDGSLRKKGERLMYFDSLYSLLSPDTKPRQTYPPEAYQYILNNGIQGELYLKVNREYKKLNNEKIYKKLKDILDDFKKERDRVLEEISHDLSEIVTEYREYLNSRETLEDKMYFEVFEKKEILSRFKCAHLTKIWVEKGGHSYCPDMRARKYNFRHITLLDYSILKKCLD